MSIAYLPVKLNFINFNNLLIIIFPGKDKFGKILEEKAEEAGVSVNYLIDEKEPTGTCAVCITGKHRYWSCPLKEETMSLQAHLCPSWVLINFSM